MKSAPLRLADLVATSALEQMGKLYAAAGDPREPALGVHPENWCWMPRRRQNLYLAIDAGPVFDESGKLIAVVETLRDITESHVAQIPGSGAGQPAQGAL